MPPAERRPGSGPRPLPPSLHPRGRRAGRAAVRAARGEAPARHNRRLIVTARVVAGALSLLLLVGSGYGWAADRILQSKITHVAGLAPGEDTDGKAQNILLIGDDHRPAGASPQVLAELSTQQDGGGTNTDTMMLLHIPADGRQPTVISFPRDSWVDIAGHGKAKLNSAFSIGAAHGGGDAGGIKLLVKTLQQLTGLSIDHFIRVSLLGFYEIAKVLGPIQVCLNEPAHDPDSGVDLPAGVSTLDAKQALSFVRQRHGLPRGDLDREVRQQYFLSVELHKVLSSGVLLNPSRLRNLLDAVGSALQTDPDLDLLRLATLFPHLSASAVRFTTIPITGTPTITDANGNRVSIVAVDTLALPAFIAEVVGEPSAYTGAQPADPKSVSVQVVNATGTPGLARQQAAALSRQGFRTTAVTGDDPTTLTTVTYPAGQEAAAKALAQRVPGAAVAQSDSVKQVTLTLGGDGLRVTGPSDGSSSSGAAPASSAPAPHTGGLTHNYTSGQCIN